MALFAEMLDRLYNTGEGFTQPKGLDFQSARATVFSLNKNWLRKVLRQRRLADAGQAVDTMIGGNFAVVRMICT